MQFSSIKFVLALPLLLSPLTSALNSSMMGMSSSSASTTFLPTSATLTVAPSLPSTTSAGMYPISANATLLTGMSTETTPLSNATVIVTGVTTVTGTGSMSSTTGTTAKPTSAAAGNRFYQENAMVALAVGVMASAVMAAVMA